MLASEIYTFRRIGNTSSDVSQCLFRIGRVGHPANGKTVKGSRGTALLQSKRLPN
jgi:hypothetical protein